LRSLGLFEGGLRKAIHRLKYSRDLGLGEVLARSLIELLNDIGWEIDIIIPVPLSLDRLKERGYNQASLLALPMALRLGLPYRPKLLMKVKETKSQVGLSVEMRRQNVAGSFKANSHSVQGKSILLVDDVATSGATLDACAGALLEAGSSYVYGITLARPRGYHNDDPARPVDNQGRTG
jgi:ComF family protein